MTVMTVATYLVVQSSKQNITTSFKYQPTAGCQDLSKATNYYISCELFFRK
jgi:hypothetical protein